MTPTTHAPVRGRRYTLEADLAPIMEGRLQLPNFEELSNLAKAVASIASGGGLQVILGVQRARLPGQQFSQWARYFLDTSQGGGFTGEGYVMLYGGGEGRIARFAICKHQAVEDPGANHNRGWHPAHCGLCGFDLTVDSGD